MKYATFNRDNLIWIGLSISIFFLIFYLFSDYKIRNNKIVRLSQKEHLTSLPSCKTFDCSDVKGPVGTTYKKCLSGDPTCKEGQRCSVCTSASTNPSCYDDGHCAGDGEEPHGQPGHEGHDVGCCPGTKQFMNKLANPSKAIAYYGGMKSGGKRIDIVVDTPYITLKFNIRNKQGGVYPSHIMCDYSFKRYK